MKSIAVIVVALLGQVLAFEPVQLHYHMNVGVPLAEKVKAAEAIGSSGARIVGGSPVSLGQYPYFGGLLVSLQIGALSVCGSSLVSHTKLITAAHCWRDGQNVGVSLVAVLGSVTLFTGGVRVSTSQVAIHEGYNWNTLSNNIAVITIPWTDYTNVITPVRLPEGYMATLTFAGNSAQAAGFGRTSDGADIPTSQVLSSVTIPVLSNMVCRDTFGLAIEDSMICTSGEGGRGTCGGDTGGPLAIIINNEAYLIGVTSFTAAGGCEQGFPAGFVRVTSYMDWIGEHL